MELGICVSAQAQGHGVGKALMAALLDYADNCPRDRRGFQGSTA